MTEFVLWVLLLTATALLGARLRQIELVSPDPTDSPGSDGISGDALLGPSRSPLPELRSPDGSVPALGPTVDTAAESPDYEALTSAFAQLADYADEVPAEFDRLDAEEIQLGAPVHPLPPSPGNEPGRGLDLDDYADHLDDLALRISYLVTGQLREELEPALKEWVRDVQLEGTHDADRLLHQASDRLDAFGALFDRVTESG